MDIFRYIRLILRLGIERADRREFMVTAGLLIIAPIIAVIFGWQFQITGIQWAWCVLGAIGFDLLIVIPAKIGIRYIHITTPQLKLSIESEPVESGSPAPGTKRSLFWRIRVKNSTKVTLARCYAQVERFLLVSEQDGRRLDRVIEPWPMPGHDLPWARQSGGRFERDMGAGDMAYIDYAVTNQRTALFTVPTHPNASDERPLYSAFLLPVGIYEITIIVTARMKAMTASRIRFLFSFKGNSAEVTELPIR